MGLNETVLLSERTASMEIITDTLKLIAAALDLLARFRKWLD